MEQEILLQAKNITVEYGGVRALDNVSVSIDEGQVVALMGPNGAGKSTVLKSIFGIAPVTKGKVLWHEHEVSPVSYEMVERGISFVPQGRQIFKSLSVKENLEMGGVVITDRKLLKERIEEVLELFPALRKKIDAPAGSLSGGQQQMVAIARGLITDPKVLFLDEPTLGLAPKIVKEVFAKIKEINAKRGTAMVIVEHNLPSLFEIVDKAYLLARGKVVAEDKPEVLTNSGILEDVFMGRYKEDN